MIQGSELFRDLVEIWLTFMSIGVFSIYGKIILAYSPNTFILFKRVLHARINTFGVFSNYDKTILAYFRTTHREIRIRLNKFALLTIPGNFKGKLYQKIEWGITYLPLKNNLQILFSKICVYGEYA
jgi:hypothetical protein